MSRVFYLVEIMPADPKPSQRALATVNQKLNIDQIPQGGNDLRMVLRQTAANLTDALNDEKIFVDNRVLSNIEVMHDDFDSMATRIRDQSTRIGNTITNLGNDNRTANKRADLAAEQQKYDAFLASNNTAIIARTNEYLAMYNNASNFNFNGRLTETQRTIPLGPAATHDIDMHSYLMDTNNANSHPNEYKLCAEDGTELEEDNGAYILNVGGQEFRLRGVTLPNPNGNGPQQTNLSFNNFRRSPSNIELPSPLKLSISAIYNDVSNTGFDLINSRKLELEIGVRLTPNQRNTAFAAINTNNVVATQLTNTIARDDTYYASYGTAMEELYSEQWKALDSQEMKNRFIDRVLPQVAGFEDIRNPQALPNLVQEFRNWMTGRAVFDEETPVDIPPAILRDEGKLQLWILQNYLAALPLFLPFYIQKRLEDPTRQADLLAVGTHLQDYSIQKANNTTDDIVNTLLSAETYANAEHRPQHRTNNYMRYLVGAEGAISEQSVEVDNTTINYGMGVTVSQNGMIEVSVVMDNASSTPGEGGEKNPQQVERVTIPSIKAGDAGAVIRGILRNQHIPQGHVRQHVAFNVIKVLIEHMQKQGVELRGVVDAPGGLAAAAAQSPDGATTSHAAGYGSEFFLESQDGGVRMGHIDTRGGGGQTQHQMLYDEEWFTTTGDVRQKRAALERMSHLFTMSMSQFHERQESGNEARGLLARRPWRSRNINGFWGTRRWTKLKNWNTENNYVFSLDEQIVSPDGNKNARVSYDGDLFHVTLEWKTTRGETIHKTFKTSDVRKLMNLKHTGFLNNFARTLTGKSLGGSGARPRYFDGLELPLMAATNEAVFNQLRKNTKISTTNFGIEDPRTGRVYVIDKDGSISYVSYRQQDDEPRRGGWSPFALIRRGKRSLTKRNREGQQGQGSNMAANSTWLGRTSRRVGRFMGTRYFNIQDEDMPQARIPLTPEQRVGFFNNADLMEEMQQAFKRRIDKRHWM